MANTQEAADKEGRRMVREAYKAGRPAPFSLSRLIDLKLPVKVIRAVYRKPVANQE